MLREMSKGYKGVPIEIHWIFEEIHQTRMWPEISRVGSTDKNNLCVLIETSLPVAMKDINIFINLFRI